MRERAYSMPLTSPAFPRGPYRYVGREYMIVTYRTDPAKLKALVPEPLQVEEPLVKYEFIRMPNSTGFGDYTETGQVIPVSLGGRKGGYSHCMFLNDEGPIADRAPIKVIYRHAAARVEESPGALGLARIRLHSRGRRARVWWSNSLREDRDGP